MKDRSWGCSVTRTCMKNTTTDVGFDLARPPRPARQPAYLKAGSPRRQSDPYSKSSMQHYKDSSEVDMNAASKVEALNTLILRKLARESFMCEGGATAASVGLKKVVLLSEDHHHQELRNSKQVRDHQLALREARSTTISCKCGPNGGGGDEVYPTFQNSSATSTYSSSMYSVDVAKESQSHGLIAERVGSLLSRVGLEKRKGSEEGGGINLSSRSVKSQTLTLDPLQKLEVLKDDSRSSPKLVAGAGASTSTKGMVSAFAKRLSASNSSQEDHASRGSYSSAAVSSREESLKEIHRSKHVSWGKESVVSIDAHRVSNCEDQETSNPLYEVGLVEVAAGQAAQSPSIKFGATPRPRSSQTAKLKNLMHSAVQMWGTPERSSGGSSTPSATPFSPSHRWPATNSKWKILTSPIATPEVLNPAQRRLFSPNVDIPVSEAMQAGEANVPAHPSADSSLTQREKEAKDLFASETFHELDVISKEQRAVDSKSRLSCSSTPIQEKEKEKEDKEKERERGSGAATQKSTQGAERLEDPSATQVHWKLGELMEREKTEEEDDDVSFHILRIQHSPGYGAQEYNSLLKMGMRRQSDGSLQEKITAGSGCTPKESQQEKTSASSQHAQQNLTPQRSSSVPNSVISAVHELNLAMDMHKATNQGQQEESDSNNPWQDVKKVEEEVSSRKKMEVKKLIHKSNGAEEDNAITISFAPRTETIETCRVDSVTSIALPQESRTIEPDVTPDTGIELQKDPSSAAIEEGIVQEMIARLRLSDANPSARPTFSTGAGVQECRSESVPVAQIQDVVLDILARLRPNMRGAAHSKEEQINLTAEPERGKGDNLHHFPLVPLAEAVRNASSVDILRRPSIDKAVQTQALTDPASPKTQTQPQTQTQTQGGGPRDDGGDHHGTRGSLYAQPCGSCSPAGVAMKSKASSGKVSTSSSSSSKHEGSQTESPSPSKIAISRRPPFILPSSNSTKSPLSPLVDSSYISRRISCGGNSPSQAEIMAQANPTEPRKRSKCTPRPNSLKPADECCRTPQRETRRKLMDQSIINTTSTKCSSSGGGSGSFESRSSSSTKEAGEKVIEIGRHEQPSDQASTSSQKLLQSPNIPPTRLSTSRGPPQPSSTPRSPEPPSTPHLIPSKNPTRSSPNSKPASPASASKRLHTSPKSPYKFSPSRVKSTATPAAAAPIEIVGGSTSDETEADVIVISGEIRADVVVREVEPEDHSIALAIKDSMDPYTDFRESMLEMMAGREIWPRRELQELLDCFLRLNQPVHHSLIVHAFADACFGKAAATSAVAVAAASAAAADHRRVRLVRRRSSPSSKHQP